MKIISSFIIGGLLIMGQASVLWAAPTTYIVSATVPTATGVGINVSNINAITNVFTAQSGTTLSFDPLTYTTPANIYLPNHYYALDFGVTNGAGATDVTVTYNEGTNPNGTVNGLGYKSTATFVKEVVGTTSNIETALAAHGPKKRLIDLNAEHVAYTELSGAFLRIYLGIWTGNPAQTYLDPANGQPFTAADAPGVYTGALVVTAVVN